MKSTSRRATRFRSWRTRAEAAVNEWNLTTPVGAAVRYWPGLKEGPGVESTTTCEAFVLGGHTAVVRVAGHASCLALTHVERIGAPTNPAA